MNKPVIFIIGFSFFFLTLLMGYALGSKGNLNFSSEIALNNKEMSEIKTPVNPELDFGPVRGILSSFQQIKTQEDIVRLTESNVFNTHLLVIQKVLNETNSLSEDDKITLEKQMDIVLGLMFDFYYDYSDTSTDFQSFKTREEFIIFMKNEGLAGRVLGEDFELSEIISGNREYCNNNSTFPTENDKNWCIAQIDFFQSKSLSECSSINEDFPEFKKICEDYYKSIK